MTEQNCRVYEVICFPLIMKNFFFYHYYQKCDWTSTSLEVYNSKICFLIIEKKEKSS